MSTTGLLTKAETDALDCRATAALLRSVATVEWAAHAGAVVTVIWHLWPALAVWGVVLYFAVRVRLDAELLTLLAEDPVARPPLLDDWLQRAGLRGRSASLRTIADRCRGARRLARNLVGAFAIEMLALAALIWRGAA